VGHWIPVTWLTFGVDHALWGMNAFGYHLTNIPLHAASPALFCHGQTGALAGDRGDLGSAIAHFERVVALRPGNVHHRRNLGLALLKAGRPAEAATQLELILAREPTDADTPSRLGWPSPS